MPSKLLPLTGYADPLSGRPGDTIDFQVSSQGSRPWQPTLVRIRCADPNPAGPGIVEEDIECEVGGPFPPRAQPFYPGSYGIAEGIAVPQSVATIRISATFSPFLLQRGKRQSVITLIDADQDSPSILVSLETDGEREAVLRSGEEKVISFSFPFQRRRWYRLEAELALESRSSSLMVEEIEPAHTSSTGCRRQKDETKWKGKDMPSRLDCLIAAGWDQGITNHFNGKIESPAIHCGSDEVLAKWDFSKEISTLRMIDIGPGDHHGRLVNFPTRAMTGSLWDGSEMCWRHQPSHYGAIHFHEDDIIDFEWESDFSFRIPDDLPSGSYAMRLDDGEHRDWLPFYVLPPKGNPTNRLCVLISTFTYAIYGNHARADYTEDWARLVEEKGGYPWLPGEYREYGLSTYNVHPDGSGICHASHRRPLLTMRPGYVTFPDLSCSGVRHYQADSHLLYWLQEQGIGFDVVTDHELHEEGVSALVGYAAVCTGSHPEYHTSESLNALEDWRRQSGNFLYLGGNGFYWRVARHPEIPGVLEVRRAEGGIRAWAAEPGEYYHAFDGQYGGLWRNNGRPPQLLGGVGFSAQGKFYGTGYRRTDESYDDPGLAFLFEGIEGEILGDFGLCGGGAAGFELDRFDPELGSDPTIKVIASSENHHDSFIMVPEERLTHITNRTGLPEQDVIHADMVYLENDKTGLFATGSITFLGSLLVNGGDNNISKLLGNVLRHFLGSEDD